MVTAEDFDTSGVFDLVAKRHRVIAFDRPGFGYSDRPHGSAWSAGTQADLLRDAFAIIGIKPVHLGRWAIDLAEGWRRNPSLIIPQSEQRRGASNGAVAKATVLPPP
jgi:pimeloyl-ACP methyl ester carboxylesterase